ncbi:hypothetical protein [Fusobacterium phage Fnu1]|uniref:Uncharacterized protein n=1 Tax=Fusobacterium phage Fnu1 TaxID=2530024 RepID=A0A481W674_9CAUD|nr:hypothetical protein KMD24_gp156 [Fusobacterium phage Fnu1]QBJ04226.1 hypothetical protein [Fusobacterium phage Fnu1]
MAFLKNIGKIHTIQHLYFWCVQRNTQYNIYIEKRTQHNPKSFSSVEYSQANLLYYIIILA